MKRILLSALVGAVLSNSPVFAADEHHPEKASPAAKAGRPLAQPKTDEEAMLQMQQQMKKMHNQMSRMQQATDPAERQKLMDEHMQSMREGMQTMHGIGGGMMSGDMLGQMPKDGTAKSGPMAGGKMSAEMMQRRMDMMQMMMEQMIEHQSAMQGMPK